MLKNNTYFELVKLGIFNKIDVNETKIYEDDVVIAEEYANANKKYKIDTANMSNEEVIISLLTKQTIYLKKISFVVVCCFVLGIIAAIVSGF